MFGEFTLILHLFMQEKHLKNMLQSKSKCILDLPINAREQTIDHFSWLWSKRVFLNVSHFYIPTMTAGAPNELMATVE